MGERDSSITRVAPIFDRLFDSDPSGRLWLARLLRLGDRSSSAGLPDDVGELPADHPRWWGSNERGLGAPPRLLEWLVQAVTEERVLKARCSPDVREKRLRLARRDAPTIATALELIRKGRTHRAWYVLEGITRPDACVQTDRALLVIEGKHTEQSCTSITEYMECRSQLLRHMDAAFEARDGRRVLGLLIVEGKGGADAVAPSPHWVRESDKQVNPSVVERSLLHRTVAERCSIVGGVLGVTTWQRVCAEFGHPWPPDDRAQRYL